MFLTITANPLLRNIVPQVVLRTQEIILLTGCPSPPPSQEVCEGKGCYQPSFFVLTVLNAIGLASTLALQVQCRAVL